MQSTSFPLRSFKDSSIAAMLQVLGPAGHAAEALKCDVVKEYLQSGGAASVSLSRLLQEGMY